MKRCGVDMDDILFMTIKEFRQNNPELQNLSKEIQIMRYEYFESFRKQKLKEIIEVTYKTKQGKRKPTL